MNYDEALKNYVMSIVPIGAVNAFKAGWDAALEEKDEPEEEEEIEKENFKFQIGDQVCLINPQVPTIPGMNSSGIYAIRHVVKESYRYPIYTFCESTARVSEEYLRLA